MTYWQFRDALLPFAVFSTRDIIKQFPLFDNRRLVEWQEKGYIHKLVNKWYLFTELPLNEMLLYRISNCLYRPSYISLESALSYYNLIPEGVYSHQAVTTRKTVTYETPAGTFNYRTLKSGFFFGYQVLYEGQLPVLMAEAEKALLDFLYLHSRLKTIEDLEALRFNYMELHNSIDWSKMEKYALAFDSKVLDKRIMNLKKTLSYVNPT